MTIFTEGTNGSKLGNLASQHHKNPELKFQSEKQKIDIYKNMASGNEVPLHNLARKKIIMASQWKQNVEGLKPR